jgi:hypothetical protein
MYHETRFVDDAGSSAVPQVEVTVSHAEESDTAAVSGGAAISSDRPKSVFPGGPLAPGHIKQLTTEEQTQIPTLSKKRNLPTGSEDLDVHLRPPKPSNQAQLNSWEQ